MDEHSHKPDGLTPPKISGLAWLSPAKILKEAIRAVPAVKYALGVAGIAAVIAIIAGFKINYKVTVLGIIIMFLLMFLLVIFSAFARSATKSLRNLGLTLAWSFVILTIATALLIFTEFFFSWPRPLEQTAESIMGQKTIPTPTPNPITTRLLNYSISVCKAPVDPGCQNPFPLAGEINFEENYKIKVTLSSPQTGQLYVVNQGPLLRDDLPQYVFLFPNERTNDGSARLYANQMITIPRDNWLRFDQEQGKEKLWLVWSAQSVGILENAAREAMLHRERDTGAITRPALIVAIREFLEQQPLSPPEVVRNEEINQTSVKTQGELLIYAIKLEHH